MKLVRFSIFCWSDVFKRLILTTEFNTNTLNVNQLFEVTVYVWGFNTEFNMIHTECKLLLDVTVYVWCFSTEFNMIHTHTLHINQLLDVIVYV